MELLSSLRHLTREDADEYHAFRQEQLAASPSAFTSTADEESEKPVSWAADRIASPTRPDDFIIGAFDATSRLVGMAGLSVPTQRQLRHKGMLFGMAVASEASGQGVGRALVARLIVEARAINGLKQIVLTVTEGNGPAEHLYRSSGFEVFGREPRAVMVDGEPITKLHMVHMLDDYIRPSRSEKKPLRLS